MHGWMMLSEVICMIGVSGLPENVKLSLSYLVSDPIKLHVNCLGSFLFECVIGNSTSCAVVCLQWCGQLWMSKFFQCNAERTCMLGIEKKCSQFSFSCTGHHIAHDLAEDVYGSIVRGWTVRAAGWLAGS